MSNKPSAGLLYACVTLWLPLNSVAAAQSPAPPSQERRLPDAGYDSPSLPSKSRPLELGMPIRDVMNGIIDFWAFGVEWMSASDRALSDDDWQSLSLASLNLTAAGTVITVPGAGPNDAAWVADADWMKSAKDMQSASILIERAAQRKDRKALKTAANGLASACLSCHTRFKPASTLRAALRNQ